MLFASGNSIHDGMEQVKLTDICNPRQWKTIPASDLMDSGFPVYGANGVIGYYNEYNHESPVVAITCRGATCGTINITVPKAYITGNAMCLDDVRSDIDLKYLYYCLLHYDFSKVISGSAQPQITRQGLEKVNLRIGAPNEQQSVITVLDHIKNIIDARQRQLRTLDTLIKARFVEMFGDPIRNTMKWDTYQLDDCLDRIDNGKSFVCSDKPRNGNYPAVLKLSAATYGDYRPSENKALLDETQFVENAEVRPGDLLFTRKNTPELVGMAAYVQETPSKLMMPDLIFRLVPNVKMNAVFLWQLINCKEFRPVIQAISGGSAKSMSNISKERLGKIRVICPPRDVQDRFVPFMTQVDKSKVVVQAGLDKAQLLFDSLMQKYFG